MEGERKRSVGKYFTEGYDLYHFEQCTIINGVGAALVISELPRIDLGAMSLAGSGGGSCAPVAQAAASLPRPRALALGPVHPCLQHTGHQLAFASFAMGLHCLPARAPPHQ